MQVGSKVVDTRSGEIFAIVKVEGNIAYFDNDPDDPSCFIWRFKNHKQYGNEFFYNSIFVEVEA